MSLRIGVGKSFKCKFRMDKTRIIALISHTPAFKSEPGFVLKALLLWYIIQYILWKENIKVNYPTYQSWSSYGYSLPRTNTFSSGILWISIGEKNDMWLYVTWKCKKLWKWRNSGLVLILNSLNCTSYSISSLSDGFDTRIPIMSMCWRRVKHCRSLEQYCHSQLSKL